MATTYLTRTSGTPTNALKWTFSAWVKNSQVGTGTFLLDFNTDTNNRSQIGFESDGKLTVYEKVSGSTSQLFQTNALYRDLSGWYNFVISCDRTLGTAADRTKIYVNGVRETSFSASNNPAQNTNGIINTAVNTLIGKYSQSGVYFNGLLSHVHFVDGTAYPASTFGSTDSVTGQWKINPSPSITMGNNGFTILKDGNTITDQSTNSNDFSLGGGTLTETEDCPDNVFSTWNPLNGLFSASIQSNGVQNGNTYVASTASNEDRSFGSTLAFTGTGKYYMEFKVGNLGGGVSVGIGEVDAMQVLLNQTRSKFCNNAKGYAYLNSGSKEVGGSGASYGNSFTSLDYIGLAYNNGALWFSKNGTWQNSATISEINAGTTTNAAFTGIDTTKQYFIMFNGFNDAMIEMNAGNGYFRTTVVGSPNNPTSGDTSAKFKYTVPNDYQPVSTKGLNA